MLRATTAPARWDLEVDVVAVGSGLGAMSGAIAAHDAGASVAILEKAPKLGGVCAYSGGEVFVGCNHKLAEEGRPDDPAAAKAYLDFLAGGYAEPELARVLFERVIAQLHRADHAVRIVAGGFLHQHRRQSLAIVSEAPAPLPDQPARRHQRQRQSAQIRGQRLRPRQIVPPPCLCHEQNRTGVAGRFGR